MNNNINWKDSPTIFAVPGRQVALLSDEDGERIVQEIERRKLTRESRKAIAQRVKPFLGKPESKNE